MVSKAALEKTVALSFLPCPHANKEASLDFCELQMSPATSARRGGAEVWGALYKGSGAGAGVDGLRFPREDAGHEEPAALAHEGQGGWRGPGSGGRNTSAMSPSPARPTPVAPTAPAPLGGRGQWADAPGGESPTLSSPAPRNRQVCFSSFSSKILRAHGSFRERVRKQGMRGSCTQPQLDIAAETARAPLGTG